MKLIDDGISLVIRLSGFKLHSSQLTIFITSSVFSFFQEVWPGQVSVSCHMWKCRSQWMHATFAPSSSIHLCQKNPNNILMPQYIYGFFYVINALIPLVSTAMCVDGNGIFHFYIGFGAEVWNLQVQVPMCLLYK